MAGAIMAYYSINALFATWLQTEFKVPAADVASPILLSALVGFTGCVFFGWAADSIGRRWAMIIQAIIGCVVAPLYLMANDLTWISTGFVIQGMFGGAMCSVAPSYLTERFPTEVRGTASAFCYHVGMVFGGLVPPAISYFAVEQHLGFAVPMLIGTLIGVASVIIALLISPETKGKVFVSDLMSHHPDMHGIGRGPARQPARTGSHASQVAIGSIERCGG
jgi:SHS family lactate transporter-like MFS transporter